MNDQLSKNQYRTRYKKEAAASPWADTNKSTSSGSVYALFVGLLTLISFGVALFAAGRMMYAGFTGVTDTWEHDLMLCAGAFVCFLVAAIMGLGLKQ